MNSNKLVDISQLRKSGIPMSQTNYQLVPIFEVLPHRKTAVLHARNIGVSEEVTTRYPQTNSNKRQMFQSNLVTLIERERKVNYAYSRHKHPPSNARVVLPELKKQSASQARRNGRPLPLLNELLAISHIEHLPTRKIIDTYLTDHSTLRIVPAKQMILVARKAARTPNRNHSKAAHSLSHKYESVQQQVKVIKPQSSNPQVQFIDFTTELQESLQKPLNQNQSDGAVMQRLTKNELSKNGKTSIASRAYYYSVPNGGNNQELVKSILETRTQWKELQKDMQVGANFKWMSNADNYQFGKLDNQSLKRMINHFEFHHELTTKNGLVKNLQTYCQSRHIELFTLTPITFTIDFDDEYCDYNLKQFLYFFIRNKPRKDGIPDPQLNLRQYRQVPEFMQHFGGYMAWQNSQLKRQVSQLSKPVLYPCYRKQQSYVWLLKPTGLNRGRGIQIFNSLDALKQILLKYMVINNRKKFEFRRKDSSGHIRNADTPILQSEQNTGRTSLEAEEHQVQKSGNIQAMKPSEPFQMKSCSFVIQKYIEDLLLIGERKFDIRVWVLLKEDMSLYFFKEGYLRLSSEKYSMDISNYFVHLTNNAVQRQSNNYGNYEFGNQLSFANFREYLSANQPSADFNAMLDRMKQLCFVSISSVRSKINARKRKNCFEIFGYDFIVDKSYKVWLIEVNTNPCIEASSPILRSLIPRMLNDAFKLTIDEVFHKNHLKEVVDLENPEKTIEPMSFHVEGYKDQQNIWEHIGKVAPNVSYKSHIKNVQPSKQVSVEQSPLKTQSS